MPATGKYAWLNSIYVVLLLPPSNPDAETALNDIYSDDLHRLDDLFTANRDDVSKMCSPSSELKSLRH
jgi:hypothetical protein